MAAFLYLIGTLGLLVTVWITLNAPVLMAAPAVQAMLFCFLLIGVGRLVEESVGIRRNTEVTADYFRWLRKRQEEQANAQQPAPATPEPEPAKVRKRWFR